MNVKVPSALLKRWAEKVGLDTEEDRIFPDGLYSWGRGDKVPFETQFVEADKIDRLLAMAKADRDGKDKDTYQWNEANRVHKAIRRQLSAVRKARSSTITTIPKTLPMLKELMHKYVETGEHRWLFYLEEDILEPLMVTEIKHHARKKGEPATVTMELEYFSMGKRWSSTLTFDRDHTKHSSVQKLLENKKLYVETEELYEEYEERFKKYLEYRDMIGEQFLAHGKARRPGGRRLDFVLAPLGSPVKVIMEEVLLTANRGRTHYWDTAENLTPPEDLSDEEQEDYELGFRVQVPHHLYLKVFSLVHYEYFELQLDNLEIYVYDESVIDKLVLADDVKELVDFVVTSVGKGMGDIVKGKSAGVIIMSMGLPGVGKTLTAEVYSEKIKRPLYTVEASQLGLTIEDLEKNLKLVLEQAVRWRALLMIDEADVYIHTRGDDIKQNAVVGTFLRTLEYYQGVLFMTTNREVVIDDAILSRCNAIVRYKPPNEEEQEKIWAILAKEFNVKLKPSLIMKIVKEFNYLTGREIKNFLKLAVLYAERMNEEVNLKVFKTVSKYQHYVNKPEDAN